jgi:hypothetical protein
MRGERRIKVDFPDAGFDPSGLSQYYLDVGEDMVECGEVPDFEAFVKNLEEYNRLQYRLMDKTESLCESMEAMLDNEFVIVNDLNPIFDEVDRITERMEEMKYLIPCDEVLEVLERYLSLHQRLFDKPVFYVQAGWDVIQDYGL